MFLQLLKSTVFLSLGAAPGAWLCATSGVQFIAATIFGGLVGLGFSLPGVSVSRVFRLFAGMIALHNIPILGESAFNAITGTKQETRGADEISDAIKEAVKEDFHKLDKVDLITVSDIAAQRMEALRPPDLQKFPFRISAEINPDNPYFLVYQLSIEPEWTYRDFHCLSNGIDFVIDAISVKRLPGTRIEWEERRDQAGFSFQTPNWPRSSLDQEPWEAEQQLNQASREGTSTTKVGVGVVFAIVLAGVLITAVRIGPTIFKKSDSGVGQVQPNALQLQQRTDGQADDWQEKMMRDESMQKALSILLSNEKTDKPPNQPKPETK